METTTRTVSRRQLSQQIERWRDNLLDWDIRVDDDRRDVDAAVVRLQESVHQRDAAARHFAQLVTWHDELQARIEVFGPETVARHVAMLTEACG
jgi:hypothetical protein